MTRIAYYALHYGAEYLAWSVRSVQEAVDEIHVLYTDRPSFSHKTDLACPESEQDLRREANRFLKKPLFWHSGRWESEGAHRNRAVEIAAERGASQVLVVDADEVWEPETVSAQLANAAGRPQRNMLVPFIHFWRSFGHVCRDPARPVRIINTAGRGDCYLDPQAVPVLHFGYAQGEAITRYKIGIHGHKNEWRPDWWESKFLAWRPGSGMKDVHPTCGWNSGFNDYFWNPKPVDAALAKVVSETMGDHPNFGKELIR